MNFYKYKLDSPHGYLKIPKKVVHPDSWICARNSPIYIFGWFIIYFFVVMSICQSFYWPMDTGSIHWKYTLEDSYL